MSNKVIITADSTCDLPKELADRFDIKIIPLTVLLGDDSYTDDGSITNEMIFKRYSESGILPKTSAPGMQRFLDFFSSFTSRGYDIVHLDISAQLSSTYSTACIAAEEFDGVYTVDSRMLSSGIALLAIEGALCRDKGMDAKSIADYLTSLTDKVDTSFVLDTLELMWKGGRCSSVAALGANLLKLKPALQMKDGKLEVYKKYRGCIVSVYKQYIKERLEGKTVHGDYVFLTDAGDTDDMTVAELTVLIKELTGAKEVFHSSVGSTVACHCGPGTLGVLFINE